MKDEGRKQTNKKAIIALVAVLSVLVIIFGGTRISIAKRNKAIKQADTFVTMGKYQKKMKNLIRKLH